ncbi:MAG: hypothetical protein O7G87_23140, partial [bacterium]|nr:hypothetical protein [bacterium]
MSLFLNGREFLDTIVPKVDDVEIALIIQDHIRRPLELAGTSALRAKGDQKYSLECKLLNTMVVKICYEYVSLGSDRHC